MKPVLNFIVYKNSNCVDELRNIYNENDDFSDGTNPYMKVIDNCLLKDDRFTKHIISIGSKNEVLKSKNFFLKSYNVQSNYRLFKLLNWLKFNVYEFFDLIRKQPVIIINMLPVFSSFGLYLYSALFNCRHIPFFTTDISNDRILKRKKLASFLFEKIDHVYSRNKTNLEFLKNIKSNIKGEVFRPEIKKNKNYQKTILGKDINFKFLFIGRLAHVKGIKTLLEVAEYLNKEKITFYIIGNGPLKSEIENFISAKKLNNVVLLGFIPNCEIHSYIIDSNAGIIPSLSEGICKTAIEFSLYERIVIGSDIKGLSEQIIDGYNGILVKKNDYREFVKAIKKIYNDVKFYNQLNLNAVKFSKKLLKHDNKDFDYYLEKIKNEKFC